MKKLDKQDTIFLIVSILVSIFSFVVAGLDAALVIKKLAEGNIFGGLLFIALTIWLFYWGIRNGKNALKLINELKEDENEV